MRVFNVDQIEIFLPIRSFFGERWIAEARLDPESDPIWSQTGFIHIINVLVAGD